MLRLVELLHSAAWAAFARRVQSWLVASKVPNICLTNLTPTARHRVDLLSGGKSVQLIVTCHSLLNAACGSF